MVVIGCVPCGEALGNGVTVEVGCGVACTGVTIAVGRGPAGTLGLGSGEAESLGDWAAKLEAKKSKPKASAAKVFIR